MAIIGSINAVVGVTFLDGSTKEYRISGNKGISTRLARETGETGILTIWNDHAAFGIPVAGLKEWHIRDLTPEEAEKAEELGDDNFGLPRFLTDKQGEAA